MLPLQKNGKLLEDNTTSISSVVIVFSHDLYSSTHSLYTEWVPQILNSALGKMEATNDRKLLCKTNEFSNVIRKLGSFLYFKEYDQNFFHSWSFKLNKQAQLEKQMQILVFQSSNMQAYPQ